MNLVDAQVKVLKNDLKSAQESFTEQIASVGMKVQNQAQTEAVSPFEEQTTFSLDLIAQAINDGVSLQLAEQNKPHLTEFKKLMSEEMAKQEVSNNLVQKRLATTINLKVDKALKSYTLSNKTTASSLQKIEVTDTLQTKITQLDQKVK